jgi:peptidylprolyl isomerase
MFNKFELVGAGISVGLMALAIYLTQVESTLLGNGSLNQSAQLAATTQSPVTIVTESDNQNQVRANAYREASDNRGNINRMVIDDIKLGTGEVVKKGDTVAVHYVGTLQNGTEFDNSKKRGTPFEFKVGEGRVIAGWEEGLVGMQVGGQRVLVIPPEMGYGEAGVGPIPGNATLVFSIELLEIK